jgi:hypothetical protein
MLISQFHERHCSAPYEWKYVYSEIMELVEARTYVDVREEFWDVMLALQLWVFAFGFDFQIILTARHHWKYERRRARWIIIFNENGLEFSPRYLVAGSNWRKRDKVEKALNLARNSS